MTALIHDGRSARLAAAKVLRTERQPEDSPLRAKAPRSPKCDGSLLEYTAVTL